MKFFTSDLHLNHINICRGASKWDDKSACRDFNSVSEMNKAIIDSINNTVGEDDELWILGDFAFGDKSMIPVYRELILCKNLHIIFGNHDKYIENSASFRKLFTSCKYYDEIYIHDESGTRHGVVLFHYYIGGVWNKAGHGWYHLFGHSHGSLPPEYIKGKCFDIGWDVWRRPLSEHEVCKEMALRPEFESIDHHGTKTVYY